MFKQTDTVDLGAHRNILFLGDWFDLAYPTAIAYYLHLTHGQKSTGQIHQMSSY